MARQKKQLSKKQLREQKSRTTFTKIKVVGIGGAGGSVINRMTSAKMRGVEYIAINTDAQALRAISGPVKKIRIGRTITKGLGTGMNPEIGRAAIGEDTNRVKEALKGADMIFITAGMGGGTGSGAAPVVADLINQTKALTVAIVTKPFIFEGIQRKEIAEQAIKKLSHRVDTLIIIPNSRILQVIDKSTPILEAFNVADEVLKQAVQSIADILNIPGLVNVDFADIETIMRDAGPTLLGIGVATGENRAIQAAKHALENPLLDISIKGAQSVLFIITGSSDLKMSEVDEIAQLITEQVDQNAKIIFGTVINEELENKLKVTLIATGFDKHVSHLSNHEINEPVKKVFPIQNFSGEVKSGEILSSKSGKKTKIKPKIGGGVLSEDELEIPAFLRKKLM